jgi:hypothetical protein
MQPGARGLVAMSGIGDWLEINHRAGRKPTGPRINRQTRGYSRCGQGGLLPPVNRGAAAWGPHPDPFKGSASSTGVTVRKPAKSPAVPSSGTMFVIAGR